MTTIFDVMLGADVKSLIVKNNDVSVANALRASIFLMDDNSLVRVGKTISSLKLVSADVIDDDYLAKVLG